MAGLNWDVLKKKKKKLRCTCKCKIYTGFQWKQQQKIKTFNNNSSKILHVEIIH